MVHDDPAAPRATGVRGPWWLWPLVALAGVAQALSLAWPWGGQPLWWLQLASLAVFVHAILRVATPRRAGFMAWVFATAWLCGTFWWLYISMHTYGGLAAPLAVLAVVGLAAFLGSYYAIAVWWFRKRLPHSRLRAAVLFAALWLLAELARGQWWTGFPWGAIGYAHVDGPLAALARYVGVYGICFAAAFLAASAAMWRTEDSHNQKWWIAVAGVLMVLGGVASQRQTGLKTLEASHLSAPMSLALMQGQIPQDEKFQPGSGIPLALEWYAGRLNEARAQLVVAPETAIPLLPQQLPPGYLEAISARYSQPGGEQALLVGIPLGNFTEGYTNSVYGFAPGMQQPYQYDKHHLVPFGEFIPPFFRWFTEMMNIPLGDFNRGHIGQPSFVWKGERIAPNICYEDLFGEELGARFVDATQAPTFMVNLSNIGWFGNSVAIDQHLAISRMRSLEFERPMVRATNTGATAVIDHRGQVTDRLENTQRGVLLTQVRGVSGAVTPFAWWVGRLGLWPFWGWGCSGGAARVARAPGRRAGALAIMGQRFEVLYQFLGRLLQSGDCKP
ncbi:apolipoprotein N-acyltransferase [Diaphorobacter aerolatus]|uniref:Apolipoprotein N-acyltransferase n=2 Tax=Diaphorobacter aerolatus TaxID=1288495 RepID=A0A7H0GQA7_9BURK|nr:apolipoprotein N-acyltransferase [Diaphorobacter aerolatus]